MGRLADLLTEQIKTIEVEKIKTWSEDDDIKTDVVEQQKVYFWIRLYLKEESPETKIGDDIVLTYTPSGEKLETKFICYEKEGIQKDNDGIVNWNAEDNKKVFCLMVDEQVINTSNTIPFIRTLFKNSRYYEYQLVRRDELVFINSRTNEKLEYFDCDY